MRSNIKSVRDFFNGDPKGFSSNPKKLLTEAAIHNKEKGSCTLVIATIDQNSNKLKTALIGDSGYLILRPKDAAAKTYDIVYKSTEQQHAFNFPFQLGTNGDSPNSAISKEHEINKNDLVILATDGLFDNIFEKQILEHVNKFLADNPFNSSSLAQYLSEVAFNLSIDQNIVSPFAEGARKARMYYRGGKSDDITIVVGKVND